MTDDIAVTSEGPVFRIRLQRPEKRNALDGPMFAKLAEAFRQAEDSGSAHVVLLSATGPAFCAGHDLNAFGDLWPQKEDGEIRNCIMALLNLSKPLIVAVNGSAVGFGATVLLSADYVVAADSATFKFPFSRLGIVPEAGASALLARRVGDLCARDWLLSSRLIESKEALEKGLVSILVKQEQLEETAVRYAENLASCDPASLKDIRRLLAHGFSKSAQLAASDEITALNAKIPAIAAKMRRDGQSR
ncbi:Enoyl-CoA hydratase/carnithine racemase [Paraburkholderia caribensis MBA4]|uniref:Enoyl-CoA hydratase/carnithine racemase n=1 Tax=Paraburkholderia caribensis MBA4 TaxID=1323664 RepID=A0A0P0RHX4_9BURK|nr:enoyl-CoA hydratase/isomerase family protein [Paraburkholderia caribensis]ALL68382.1 Enoyl-CoA hydratase/carnithine racemase [Paraburkholderia caribensis MBA4]